MAQIQDQPLGGKTKRKIYSALNIDMTPMVDLGFLLITFFIFTTSMAEKRAANLIVPKDGKPIDVAESKALTALLDKDNRVFVYAGQWNSAVNAKNIVETNYNLYQGLGNLIRAKQKQLQGNKDGLMLLIKPLDGASYQNIIDALDEALINNVQRYAIVEATQEEKRYAQKIQY